jgi:two-component system, OmpR family, response regulator
MRLLVVEDEPKLANLLRRGLGEDGHVVDLGSTGADARWMARAVTYDAIVLDVMLPDADGFSVCAERPASGHRS